MDTKELQTDIKNMKQTITTLKDILVIRKERLARAETQLAEAIAAESKKPVLENGDYGKALGAWVFIGGKVYWEYGGVSEWGKAESLIDSRRGNFIREMEEREE